MTPDDMEEANRQLLIDLEKGCDKRAALDPVHAEFQRHIDALRALMLDYQERGRALERIGNTLLLNDGGAQRRLGQVVTEARATLKGKSHD